MFKRLINFIDYLPLAFIAIMIVVLPLIFSSSAPAANVFELFKALYFYLFLFVLILFSLIKYLALGPDRYFLPQLSADKKTLLQVLIYLIIAFFLLLGFNSLVLSGDFIQSIFGSYARQQGLTIYLAYFITFFLVAYQLAITGRQFNYQQRFATNFRILIVAASLAGLLVSLYGFLQYFGFDSYHWQEPVMADRIISSLGQPNLLASFLLLTIGASLAAYFFSRQVYWRLFFLVNILSQTLAIYFSASRAAWLAGVLVLIVFIFLAIKRRFKKYFLLLIFGLFIAGLFLIRSPILPDNRLTSSLDISRGSSAARLYFYQAAWQSVRERPLLGYGLEQGGNVFVKFYQPDWALFIQVNDYPDRAHNLLLDILLNFGLLGLLFHASLWLFIIILFFEAIRDPNFYWQFLSLWLFLVSYLISLAFGFSSVASNFYLIILLAIFFAHFLSSGRKTNNRLQLLLLNLRQKIFASRQNLFLKNQSTLLKRIILSLLIILNIVLIINFWLFIKTNIQADHLFFHCQQQAQLKIEDNLRFCFQALEKVRSPIQKKHYQNFTIRYLIDHQHLLDPSFQKISLNYLQQVYPQLNTKDYNSLLIKAKIACSLLAPETWLYYDQLIYFSPARPMVYQERATCYLSQANYSEAITDYRQALSLLPDVNDSRLSERHQKELQFYYYLLFFGLGQAQAGNQEYAAAINSYQLAYQYHPDNFYLLENIGNIYYLSGDLLSALNYYQELFEQEPNNSRWPQTISWLYQELDKPEEANFYQTIVDNLLNP